MKPQVSQKNVESTKKAFYKKRHTDGQETLKNIQSQELLEAKLHSKISFFSLLSKPYQTPNP